MTRLTSNFKSIIVGNALTKAGFDTQEKEIQEVHTAWVEKVRIFGLGGEEVAKQLEQTEADYLKLREGLRNHPALVETVLTHNRHGLVNVAGLKTYIAHPDYAVSNYNITLSAENPLVQEFHDIENRKTDLSKEKNALAAKVQGVLTTVNTVKQLLAVWPEAVELLPPPTHKPSTALPVVQVSSLNRAIGLPSK